MIAEPGSRATQGYTQPTIDFLRSKWTLWVVAAEVQIAVSVRARAAAESESRPFFDLATTTYSGTEVYASEPRALAQSTAQTFDLSSLKARHFAVVIRTPTAGANPKFTLEAGWSDGSFTKIAAPHVTDTAPFWMVVSGCRPSGDSAALILTSLRLTRNDAGSDKPTVHILALCD